MVLEDSAPGGLGWLGAGRGLRWFGEMGVHPRTGIPLLPPASTVAPPGSGAPHVSNESLVSVTESHRNPNVPQQAGLRPQGQDAAKRVPSFRPESVGWGRDVGGQGCPENGGHQIQGKYCAVGQWIPV